MKNAAHTIVSCQDSHFHPNLPNIENTCFLEAPMKQPELTILSNTSLLHSSPYEVLVEPGQELRVRCTVEGAPEMIIYWTLLFKAGGEESDHCRNASYIVKDHVISLAFLSAAI